ncbi:MAG: hypothetical protein H0T60_04130 [Acidobacteria bacterium]|nr:hypothetical protein [Acidobacteriota bacterium]
MRKSIRASMLVLALSVSAYAGDMGNGVAAPASIPPPASTTQATTEPATKGDMGNGISATTGVALNLLQTLLALF